jgi:hypothetical protein
MPTPTYDLIASTTLAATTSSVTFGSIPATYRDLILVHNGTSSNTAGVNSVIARFNSDSGNNYPGINMSADGSGSSVAYTISGIPVNYTDNVLGSGICQIFDYSATDKHKTAIAKHSNGGSNARAIVGRWTNLAAITSITLVVDTGANFITGTTFNLYGVIS